MAVRDRLFRRFIAVVVLGVVGLLMSGCAHAGPDAADGEDVSACMQAQCEVRVMAPATIPLPRDSGIFSLQVDAVDQKTATLVIIPRGRYTLHNEGECDEVITQDGGQSVLRATCVIPTRLVLPSVDISEVAVDQGYVVLRIARH